MDKTYRKGRNRDGSEDGKDRATIGVWMRLTPEEVAAAEKMAEEEGLSCRHFLRGLAEAALKKRMSNSN
jgi:hypothetical protein